MKDAKRGLPAPLKTGLKIIAAILIYAAAMLLSMIPAVLLYNIGRFGSFPEMVNNTMSSSAGNALQSALSIAALWLIYRWLVKRNWTSWEQLGLKREKAPSRLGLGFVLGALFFGAEIGALCLLGYGPVSKYAGRGEAAAAVLCGLVIYAGVAFSEEVTFRGLIQGLFPKNIPLGIAVSTLVFALIHLVNSAYSAISLVYLLVGGLAFALMRLVSDGLWLPVGFHMAWDWLEISVFGMNQESPKHWLYMQADETAGSLVCTAILALAAAALMIIYRRGHRASSSVTE